MLPLLHSSVVAAWGAAAVGRALLIRTAMRLLLNQLWIYMRWTWSASELSCTLFVEKLQFSPLISHVLLFSFNSNRSTTMSLLDQGEINSVTLWWHPTLLCRLIHRLTRWLVCVLIVRTSPLMLCEHLSSVCSPLSPLLICYVLLHSAGTQSSNCEYSSCWGKTCCPYESDHTHTNTQ